MKCVFKIQHDILYSDGATNQQKKQSIQIQACDST